MNKIIEDKLTRLPKTPGIYFHKDKNGKIIYIGKAAKLNNRVRQYFQTKRIKDPKTELLISEIADMDWIELPSETDALFLEAEMVRRYMPRYNILLRDDKSTSYIRINLKDHAPSVTLTRRPIDDGAQYFGPYLVAGPVRKALRILRKSFPFSTHGQLPSRACLQYHLGLCPGPETDQYDRKVYLKNLKKLILYIRGNSNQVIRSVEKEMQSVAKLKKYEQAAILRTRFNNLKSLRLQVIFGDRENIDLSKDHALYELTQLLSLPTLPRRIEGFDISHMSGSDLAASMVVFTNGVVNKTAYRKFKMNAPGNDDYLHMKEVIGRRFNPKNIKAWGQSDLVLIDGGKGQLSAAIEARNRLGLDVPIIGLVKKFEEIVIDNRQSFVKIDQTYLKSLKGYEKTTSVNFTSLLLPPDSHLIKLLQRIRNESHRFAISYHNVLKRKRQTLSVLDEIPGVGPATKKKLIKAFGSTKALSKIPDEDLREVAGKRAQIIREYFPRTN